MLTAIQLDDDLARAASEIRVVSLENRQYVIEYSRHILSILWEGEPGEKMPIQRCAFDQERTRFIEKAKDKRLCEDALAGEDLSVVQFSQMAEDLDHNPELSRAAHEMGLYGNIR